MAITRVGSSTFSNDASVPGHLMSSWPLSKPAGVAAGDLLVACVAAAPYSGTVTPPAGWTTAQHVDSTLNVDGSIFYKVATASEPASYSFALSSNSMSGDAVLVAYRGDDSANPVQASANAQGTAAAPSLTLAKAGLLVDVWVAAAAGQSFTPPAGMTKDVESHAYRSITLASQAVPAGATGTRTADASAAVVFSVGLTSSNVAPNAPTLNSPATNATIDRNVTQRFALTPSDPDPGDSTSQTYWRYRLIGAVTWTMATKISPNTWYDFPAGTFALGDYEWQAATRDAAGAPSNEADLKWSPSSFFTAADAPPRPTITDPINGQTISQASYEAVISAPDVDASEWRTVADDGAGNADPSTVYSATVTKTTGDLRRHTFDFPVNDRVEHLQSRIEKGGLWSTWADSRNPISYAPPTVPTFTLAPDNTEGSPTRGSIAVTITNPTPGAGQPAVAYNNVYVTDPGEAEERRATNVPTNGTWRYWDPPSGFDGTTVGRIRVEAVGSNGTSASS